jgi:hypothetical protein
VAAALAAAEIPPSKLGPARHARLSEAQRELYFWILGRFATVASDNLVADQARPRRFPDATTMIVERSTLAACPTA